MQIALVDNKRVEAFNNGKGLCPICGSDVIAKCGSRYINHWAHQRAKKCDPWWENETPWHRDWKNKFPLDCREVSHKASDGEIHRADVKTSTGIVIEIQHSSITDAERISREEFYKNLVWVVDGSGFRDNFSICHMLPNPDSELAQDLVWMKTGHHKDGANHGMFFRLSEARKDDPEITKATLCSGRIRDINDIKDELKLVYDGHHQYNWIRPRKTWLEASCPVYIDFGNEYLVKLEIYDSSGLECVKLVSKRKFVHDAMVEKNASDIATHFYPLDLSSSYPSQSDS
jgi:competence protein CoiA